VAGGSLRAVRETIIRGISAHLGTRQLMRIVTDLDPGQSRCPSIPLQLVRAACGWSLGRQRVLRLALVEFESFGELVFQDHDAAGGFDSGAPVGYFPHAGG
jgi:hypothetical protein